MTRWLEVWGRRLTLVAMTGCLYQFGAGCSRMATQELEAVFAPSASPNLVDTSALVSILGPTILHLINYR